MTDKHQVTGMYLPWDDPGPLPESPPLQTWVEVSTYGAPMRRFMLVPAAPAEMMKDEWVRVSDSLWRLDDRWTVRREGPYWRAFRGSAATLCGFPAATEAMHEAEFLRAADRAYSAPGASA